VHPPHEVGQKVVKPSQVTYPCVVGQLTFCATQFPAEEAVQVTVPEAQFAVQVAFSGRPPRR
jgi:hypothetical protein